MRRSSRQWNRPPRASRRDRRRLSLLGLCSRKSLIEQLEGRDLLDAGLAITLVNPNVAPGDQLVVSWRIAKSVLDTNSDGSIEATEATAATLTIDVVGLLNSQAIVTPTIDENAYVDADGNLQGYSSLNIPGDAPQGQQYSVWGTLQFIDQTGGVANGASLPAAAATSTGPGSLLQVQSTNTVTVDLTYSDPVGTFTSQQRFGYLDIDQNQPLGTWLYDYADSLSPTVSSNASAQQYLVNEIALQALKNDDATRQYTDQGRLQLAGVLPEVINEAYSGIVDFHKFDPTKPSVILVHGIRTSFSAQYAVGEELQAAIGDNANVITFHWGSDLPLDQNTVQAIEGTLRSVPIVVSKVGTGSLASLAALETLKASADLHLLLKLLGRAYVQQGLDPALELNVIAHSQGSVVTTAALSFKPPADPKGAKTAFPTYDANQVLFIGANLHRVATLPGQDFDYLSPTPTGEPQGSCPFYAGETGAV